MEDGEKGLWGTCLAHVLGKSMAHLVGRTSTSDCNAFQPEIGT